MFQSSDGLFHFVFANQQDCFFTDSYLKLNFRPYLYYCLQEKNYEHIYSLYEQENSCFLRAVGDATSDSEKNKKKKGIFSRISISKNNTEEKKDYISDCYKNAMKISPEEFSGAIYEILRYMEKNSNTAFIVPVNTFCELFNSKNIIKQLESIAKQHERLNSNNIIVITSSCLSSDNDKYFVSPENIRGHGNEGTGSIFYQNHTLFPEFRAYNNKSLPKLVFTYDVLKSVFNERVQYWNRLDYDDILKIVNYNAMHGIWYDYKPELYSAVISAWYGNRKFRNKYRNIFELHENNMRTNKIVYEIMKNNEILPEIMEQIIIEETDDFNYILETWQNKDSIFISDGVSLRNLEYQQSASGYIVRFSKILQSHSEISQERKNKLVEIETFFLKPAYVSSEIHHNLPHEYFSGDERIISEACSLLKSKNDWNWWDIYTAEMIIEIFLACKKFSEYTTDIDNWGTEISEPCFKLWLRGIEKAVDFSRIYPDDTKEKTEEFYNKIRRIAESGNKDVMNDFIKNSFSNVLI